jgi:4-amino-4-deoxy-L-arabinose transferase-like glycosyltransferase
LIAAAAVGLRVWRINLPVVEPYNSIARQSIVASVARNFYEHGFNFFYPEINENGRGPYLYNAEMPFYSYLMALGYKLAGGVREGVARSVSVGFSLLTLLFLYLTARRWLGEKGAAAALAFASFSPLYLAISRSLQPESAFLAGMAGAVYFFQKYLDRDDAASFWISSLCLSFAVATKFFNAYLLLLLIYMAWRKKGPSIFTDWKNYAYVAVICASFLWYWKMWQAGEQMSLAYYPYRYIAHKAGAPGDVQETFVFLPRFLQCMKIFFAHVLTLPALRR